MSSATFQQIIEATGGEYVLHGALGQSDALGSALLATEVATGQSVLLVVPPDAESLDVVGALSDAIPADAGGCAACGFRYRAWTDACPLCERLLLPFPGHSPDAAALREEVQDSLDVVGSLPHVRGGTMYFAHEADDGPLAAFALRPQPDGELALEMVWKVAPDATSAPTTTGGSASANVPQQQDDDAPQERRAYHSAPAQTPADRTDIPEQAPRTADHAPAVDGAALTRRQWLPIGLGVGALGVGALAVAGAAAFAFTRHDAPRFVTTPDVRRDSTASMPLNPPSVTPVLPAPTSAQVAAAAPPIDAGGSRNRGNVHVAGHHARDAARDAAPRNSAVITIEGGRLPSGWTVSVDGVNMGRTRQVSVPAGARTTLRIEAPGYCEASLPMAPAAGSRPRWAPDLRSRPVHGKC